MAMSRKHYAHIAELLANARISGELSGTGLDKLVSEFAHLFKQDNASFQNQKFRDAVYDAVSESDEEDDDDDSDHDDDDDDDDDDRERISCDKCQMLAINGMATHETGCPNARKDWIDGEWVTPNDDDDDDADWR